MERLDHFLSVARGHTPADLLLRGGRLVNVFSGEIEVADIAIAEGIVVGVGANYEARGVIDLDGAYVSPGYIDAHVHIESSLCVPAQFARAILPRGITAVVTDPHEIANVAGIKGVEFIASAAALLPLEVITLAPSCVPATHMATSGAAIDAQQIFDLRARGIVSGLAEVMNFPGVVNGSPDVVSKLEVMRGMPIDGHCPGLRGTPLNAYVLSGIGSDHECVDVEEAKEKLARGLYLLIREATNARNLDALLPMVTKSNARRICFCTDDRTPGDLLREGSIDMMVRRAIRAGVEPIEAIRMATLNTAEWFGLPHLGAIAPGRAANLIVFDDLENPVPRSVYARGELIARNGAMLPDIELEQPEYEANSLGACNVDWERFHLKVPAGNGEIRVIGSMPDQIVTESLRLGPRIVLDHVVADVGRDILKMTVVDRHRGSGKQGIGFIQGFGLKHGAIAGTIAHDHHNLVIIGADDASMVAAGREVCRLGGGLAVAEGNCIRARLPLPVGGLMSDRPIEEVMERYDQLIAAAKLLGSTLSDPFMAMSFMALEVIPSLKLTDHGLVDVDTFEIVDLFV
jgi:adenine deaminase